MRQASEQGLEFLQAWERLELKAYRDAAGLLSIGVGHCLSKDELYSGKLLVDGWTLKWRKGLTKSQALLLLDQDLDEVESSLSLDPWSLTVSQAQLDALCSFVFNVGTGAFRSSTLRRLLLEGKEEEAAREFPRWKWAGGKVVRGLVRRRKAEKELFQSAVYRKP